MSFKITFVFIFHLKNFVAARKGSSGKGGGSNTGTNSGESYGKYF
jgi:hypothetical protein